MNSAKHPARRNPSSTRVVCLAPLILATAGLAHQPPSASAPPVAARATACQADERRDALKAMQAAVLASAPSDVPSLGAALAPGGPLAGWRLSHGYVVLAGAGAVAVDNVAAKDPMPQLLLYAPSRSSTPGDWLDVDGPDDPYRLVGWAYIGPYTEGSTPPARPCIAADEWVVHEAGWHLTDGSMRLTPGAKKEPRRPAQLSALMWHPRVWDLHVWREDHGVPTIAFANPHAAVGGLALDPAAFFRIVNGRRQPAT